MWSIFEELYGGGPPISVIGPPIHDVTRWTVHFAGLGSDAVNFDDIWMEEFSDHESDVNSEEGVLHFDLATGQKATLEELIKVSELFGFEDAADAIGENQDIRLVGMEEGMGELYDLIPDVAEELVPNLEEREKLSLKRASMPLLPPPRKSNEPETLEEREARLHSMVHYNRSFSTISFRYYNIFTLAQIYRDFNDEDSDSEASGSSEVEGSDQYYSPRANAGIID